MFIVPTRICNPLLNAQVQSVPQIEALGTWPKRWFHSPWGQQSQRLRDAHDTPQPGTTGPRVTLADESEEVVNILPGEDGEIEF